MFYFSLCFVMVEIAFIQCIPINPQECTGDPKDRSKCVPNSTNSKHLKTGYIRARNPTKRISSQKEKELDKQRLYSVAMFRGEHFKRNQNLFYGMEQLGDDYLDHDSGSSEYNADREDLDKISCIVEKMRFRTLGQRYPDSHSTSHYPKKELTLYIIESLINSLHNMHETRSDDYSY